MSTSFIVLYYYCIDPSVLVDGLCYVKLKEHLNIIGLHVQYIWCSWRLGKYNCCTAVVVTVVAALAFLLFFLTTEDYITQKLLTLSPFLIVPNARN